MRWKKRGGRKEKEMMIPSRMILKDRLMIFQMKVKRLGGLYLETSSTYCLPCKGVALPFALLMRFRLAV